MAKRQGNELQRKDRVVAATPLVGVPQGTGGRVTTVNGFRWRRYWVTFDNGVEIGSLDGGLLTHVNKKGEPV